MNRTQELDIKMKNGNCHQSWRNRQVAAALRLVFKVTMVAVMLHAGQAFQMSMVGSRSPSRRPSSTTRLRQSSLQSSIPFAPPGFSPGPSAAPFDLTSGLVSQLAVMALKLRLAGHSDVACDVSSKPSDLLLWGRVGPVKVKGRDWRSNRGLSCRAFEASVDTCELDVSRILSDRKLVLTRPARGKAMIAFNDEDFGNFLTHPRMVVPGGLSFQKDGVKIDPSKGSVSFNALAMGKKWRCTLRRSVVNGKRKALVHVAPVDVSHDDTSQDWEALSQKLSVSASNFFNNLAFELYGVHASFDDVMVTAKGATPSLLLRLSVEVKPDFQLA